MDAPLAYLPKRILMTADTIGGVWTYAMELVRGLAPHGVEVVLATMGARLNVAQKREIHSLPNLEVFETDYKLEWMKDPWEDVALAGDWLLGLEARREPDVIHLNGYTHAALRWQAPVLVVGHSCVLSWWQAVKGKDAPATCSRYHDEVRDGIHSADLVVAPSHDMLAALQNHYGPPAETEVIYNSRDPAHSKPGTKENLILSAGRLWDEAKNVSALVAVAPKLSWPIYVAGEGTRPEGSASRHKHVRLLGRLAAEQLAPWFAKASVYALPARYEPFGLSALEAGLAGCALVLGDIPSLREIWGNAALFVPPDDHAALKDALNGLISHPALLKQMGNRARSRAMEFSPKRMVKRYLAAYSGLMKKSQLKAKELLVCGL
jgi:glycosyltransferase involved in cell wall biosynthesis